MKNKYIKPKSKTLSDTNSVKGICLNGSVATGADGVNCVSGATATGGNCTIGSSVDGCQIGNVADTYECLTGGTHN